MNMAYNGSSGRDFEADDQDGLRGGKEKIKRQERMTYSRAKNRPSVHNGIHRRRNKRSGW
jgi:hypothetical protein